MDRMGIINIYLFQIGEMRITYLVQNPSRILGTNQMQF